MRSAEPLPAEDPPRTLDDVYAAYHDGRLREAEVLLERIVDDAPDTPLPDICAARAMFATTRAEWSAADDQLLRALAASPDSAGALQKLAELCMTRGDLIQAAHWWRRLCQTAPRPEAAAGLEEALRSRRLPELAGEDELEPCAAQLAECEGRRILAITDLFHPSVGGTELVTEMAAVALQALGMEVHVATLRLEGRTQLQYRGLQIHELDRDVLAENLADVLRERNYDALLTFTGPFTELFAAVAALGVSRPRSVIVPCVNPYTYEQLHADPQRLVRYRESLHRTDAVCYSSRTGADRMVLDDISVSGHYVPNAVEHHAGVPGFRSRHGLPADVPLLVMVANFWPEKNHLELINTLSRAPGDWQLALIGGPSVDHPWLIEETRAQAARDPRITLIGSLPPGEVASALDECSLVLLPSLAEATPLVLLEAMSHRRPWIASLRTGGAHEYTGGLMAPVAQFPEAVEFILSHDAEAATLGEAGYEHWARCYRWEAVAPQYGRLLVGQPPASLRPPASSVELTDRVRGQYYTWRVSRRRVTDRAADAASVSVIGSEWPHVTCLMAARNHESFIGEALDSVLTQDYPTELLDVIVVDDGSEDQTMAVAEACAAKSEGRVQVLSQAHQGSAVAINLALRKASGALLAICDSDDVWLQHKISTQVRQFERESALALSYSDLEAIDANGNVLSTSLMKSMNISEVFGDALDALARTRFLIGSTLMLRARDVRPLDPASPYADYALAVQAAAAGRVQPLGRPFAQARVHGRNIVIGISGPERLGEARRAVIAMRRYAFGGDLAGRLHPRTVAYVALQNETAALQIRRATTRGFEQIAAVSDAERQRSLDLLHGARRSTCRDDALRLFAQASLADPFNQEAWDELTAAARARPDLASAWSP